MEFVTSAVAKSQEHVTGTVRLRLYKGVATVLGRRAPRSLYSETIATFEADDADEYSQRDADGFIRLNALRLKLGNGSTAG
jgi:argininosuccinate synthase